MKNALSFNWALITLIILLIGCSYRSDEFVDGPVQLKRVAGKKPRNVIFILSDDHRHDFMGFTGKVPWLETPNMDRLAAEGAWCKNTFVTTALCSPSRASILTGLFSHSHTVVDNQASVPDDLVFFPQYLQGADYQTAFFGKWHMGHESSDPRPGFDHWESFKGQGVYYNPTLNINGKETTYNDSTYITDILTDHAIQWLDRRKKEKPFFLYLSHKAVHADFQPARRHVKRYQDMPISLPPSFATSDQPMKGKTSGSGLVGGEGPARVPPSGEYYYGEGRVPDWQKMQRESWHGVDYMYHGGISFSEFYRQYCETLLSVDESLGRVLQYLDENGLSESTLVIYMGDNGFSFGEHGLIDKRHFYEESVRVPFLVRCPELFDGGKVIAEMVQNIDVAPTVLDVAGLEKPEHFHGESIMPLLTGKKTSWRSKIFYEYYWEYDYPQTPTMHGVRTDRFKLIRYHGIWDTNEFYDLKEDPDEINNLIGRPEHQELIQQLTVEIYDWLESTDGMQIPLKRTVKRRYGDHRNRNVY